MCVASLCEVARTVALCSELQLQVCLGSPSLASFSPEEKFNPSPTHSLTH